MRAAGVLIKQMRLIADIDGANSVLSCETRPVPSFKPVASSQPRGLVDLLALAHGGRARRYAGSVGCRAIHSYP